MTLISLDTIENTIDWRFGERLLGILVDESELLAPDAGVNEAPLDWSKCGIKINEIRDLEEIWGTMLQYPSIRQRPRFSVPAGVYWRRRAHVRYQASIEHTRIDDYGRLSLGWIRLHSSWSDKIDWLSLFRRWSELAKPTVAMLDLNKGGDWDLGLSMSLELKKFAWATVIGHERARFVDVAKLRSEGFFVEEMETGFLIRLTEKYSDLKKNRAHVEAERARLKALFPPEALHAETACPELLKRMSRSSIVR